MSSPRETSGATTQLTLEYVHERGGDAALAAVLERAALPYTRAQLESTSTWVSYDERIRLFEATVKVLGEPGAMYAVGARALRSNVHQALVLLLRALGSPRSVIGHLPSVVGKFSTTSTMRIVELEPTRARIDYRLHDGYEHSPLLCRYVQGLMSVAPEIFGLPPATIAQTRCQSDGHPSCVYELSWHAGSRLPWRRRREARVRTAVEAKMLRAHLAALHSATADVVSGADLRTVLQRVAERAASAVIAQGHLLVVEDPYTGRPLVQAAGIGADRSERLAHRLLAGQDLGESAVVADIVSARHRHGRLAALYAEGQRGLTDERELLSTYAR